MFFWFAYLVGEPSKPQKRGERSGTGGAKSVPQSQEPYTKIVVEVHRRGCKKAPKRPVAAATTPCKEWFSLSGGLTRGKLNLVSTKKGLTCWGFSGKPLA